MLFFWIQGALLYSLDRAYYGRTWLDLSLVFKELPPECVLDPATTKRLRNEETEGPAENFPL
jgi:hypothetical protein